MWQRAIILAGVLGVGVAWPSSASAACDWSVQGRVRTLLADCEITEGIVIPDGVTIDGDGHRIVGADRPSVPFRGAFLIARGRSAHVRDVVVDGSALGRGCEAGDARLSGILFDGASGTIEGVTLESIARLEGACAEGTAIEIIGSRASSVNRAVQAVSVRNSRIRSFQKAGVVASGAVFIVADGNEIAAPERPLVPTNVVQISFGARATLTQNVLEGASWCCSAVAATGVLLLDAAPGTAILGNRIVGNSDVGIFAIGDRFALEGNELVDLGGDSLFDVGIVLVGGEHRVRANDVRGFTVPIEHRGSAWEPLGLPRSMVE